MSRRETHLQNQSTGAHRRHRAPAARSRENRRPQGTLPMQPPGHYEPYLDGLFTYCLSVLCEHDAAAAALGDVLALAERQRGRLRDPQLRRPWLYALARWACLRRLSERRRMAAPPMSDAVAAERHAELAALAWPEAAGTSPEQREALELAVRHQLPAYEIALVLGMETDATRTLLARAACEVERTRAALAVVETGACPTVARLARDSHVLLGTALRQELVRHVDECPECRVTAERSVAAGPWPGAATTAAPAVLAVLEAPRSTAYAALLNAMRAGAGRSRDGTPRFDRRGFPMDIRDRAARRARMRNRAVTTSVVAAVVAAPVLALGVANQGTPGAGTEARGAISAGEADGVDGHAYRTAGSKDPRARHRTARGRAPGTPVSVGVETPPAPGGAGAAQSGPPTAGAARPGPGTGAGSGRFTVSAEQRGSATMITLTASGGGPPVRWTASTTAYWLRLSASSGVLSPGESVTIKVRVDYASEPPGRWVARIGFSPSGAVVTIDGEGDTSPDPAPSPTPAHTSPPPTPQPSGSTPPA